MLLIWERSPKGGRKRKMACSHSFSLLLRFVRPGNENPRILVLSRCGGESRHPSSSADSATGGVCLECSPRSFLLLLLLLPLLHLLLLLLAASHPSLPLLFSLPRTPPLWNILVLPSCTRVATANLTLWDYVSWDSVRAHTRASRGSVSRVQLVVSRSLSLSLFAWSSSSLAPLASTINILVRDSCTATPSADHVTDICKVSIIRGTAPTNRRSRSFFFVGQGFLFRPV